MKSRIITLAKWISAMGASFVVACWAVTYDARLSAVWAERTSHHQVTLCHGKVHFIRNDDWWRKEKLSLQLDRDPVISPIHTWPGMRIETRQAVCGFEWSKGKWISPYIHVNADTEFTTPERQLKPKTFISSTTPVNVYTIPFWSLAAALTVFAVACEACQRLCPRFKN